VAQWRQSSELETVIRRLKATTKEEMRIQRERDKKSVARRLEAADAVSQKVVQLEAEVESLRGELREEQEVRQSMREEAVLGEYEQKEKTRVHLQRVLFRACTGGSPHWELQEILHVVLRWCLHWKLEAAAALEKRVRHQQNLLRKREDEYGASLRKFKAEYEGRHREVEADQLRLQGIRGTDVPFLTHKNQGTAFGARALRGLLLRWRLWAIPLAFRRWHSLLHVWQQEKLLHEEVKLSVKEARSEARKQSAKYQEERDKARGDTEKFLLERDAMVQELAELEQELHVRDEEFDQVQKMVAGAFDTGR